MLDTVSSYRTAMRNFSAMTNLEVWYARMEIESVLQQFANQFESKRMKRAEKTLAKARTKDSMAAFAKLTQQVNGRPEIVDESPLIDPIRVWCRGRSRGPYSNGCASCRALSATRLSARRPADRGRPRTNGPERARYRYAARPRRRGLTAAASGPARA